MIPKLIDLGYEKKKEGVRRWLRNTCTSLQTARQKVVQT